MASIEELRKSKFWLRKMHTVMTIRDANRDGLISKADYELVIQRYQEMGSSEEHLAKLEKVYSEIWKGAGIMDDTTKITYEQFLENLQKQGGDAKDHAALFTRQFELVDSNGDGEISFKEWVDHYTALGIDIKHARPSFDAMDTNKDGVVSKEEYTRYTTEYFYSVEDKLNSSLLYGPLVDL